MILNINKFNGQKTVTNNFYSSQNFLNKNKITVNQVAQSHYTVQGVQIYSPQEIKALKNAQQKRKQQQGTLIPVKTYQLDNYFDEFEQIKQKTPKQKVAQTLKNKSKLDVKNITADSKDQQVQKVNKKPVKQRLAQNNNILVKLQKQKNKKSVLQQKLSKLSKKYKQYFKFSNQKQQLDNNQQKQVIQQDEEQDNKKRRDSKGSQLYKSLKKIIKNKDDNSQEEEEQNKSQIKIQKRDFKKKKQTKINTKAYSIASTKQNDGFSTKQKVKKDKPKGQQDKQENNNEQQEQDENDLQSIPQVSKNKSTYSQRLGSAVHLLFS